MNEADQTPCPPAFLPGSCEVLGLWPYSVASLLPEVGLAPCGTPVRIPASGLERLQQSEERPVSLVVGLLSTLLTYSQCQL